MSLPPTAFNRLTRSSHHNEAVARLLAVEARIVTRIESAMEIYNRPEQFGYLRDKVAQSLYDFAVTIEDVTTPGPVQDLAILEVRLCGEALYELMECDRTPYPSSRDAVKEIRYSATRARRLAQLALR